METLWKDVKYGARMLFKNPGFAAVAVVTLALGIGANTAIFSLADALFHQTPQVSNADSLVFVDQTLAWRKDFKQFELSLTDYEYFNQRAESFSGLAAHYSTSPMHLVVDGEPAAIMGSVVTPNYFGVLGLQPTLGRFFDAKEDAVRDGSPVVVVSYALWQRRLGGSPQVLGRTIHLNGTAFTIVGVAPKEFLAVGNGDAVLDAWIPSSMFRIGYRYCDAFARGCNVVRLIGRLKPQRNVRDAQEELSLLARQLESEFPDTNKGRGIVVTPVRGVGPDHVREYSQSLNLLVSAVAVVLLISCANVGGLLLARSLKRRKEIAVRLALGAGRGRLVRQLLTESLLLAALGGTLGLFVAFWTKDVISSFYSVHYSGSAINFSLALSPTVLLATLGLSVVTGLLFGLVPAAQSSRVDLTAALKAETPTIRGRTRLWDVLIVAQVGLSIVLLVAAGLFVRSMASIYRGPGFDPNQVLLLRLRPSLVGYDLKKGLAFQREVIRKLELLPGVLSATPAFHNAHEGWSDARIWVPGQEPGRKEDAYQTAANMVGPRFFETLKAPLLAGREFSEQDNEGAPKVAIINDVLARHFWPKQSAIGQTLIVDDKPCQVVGESRDLQFYSFGEAPRPFIYLSYYQQATRGSNDSKTQVRVSGDVRTMLVQIRKEIAAVDPNVPISEDYPLVDRLRYQFRLVRGARTALVSLGALALFLSAIGVYGVLAFTVSQRTREIGIRMALGASRWSVARDIFRSGLTVTLIGIALGLAAAVATTRLLTSQLYGVAPLELSVYVAVAVLMAAVALAASWIPARRATRVDPMVALRYE